MQLRDVEAVIGDYSGRARRALEYSLIFKRLVDSAKQGGFSTASWAPLAELVAVEDFERVGNFKEVMNWSDYINFLTPWAISAEWESSFRRVSEAGSTVFLELEERVRMGEVTNTVNSMSVYEFNAAGKIHHLDIYLQMEPPSPEMLHNYASA